MEDLENKESVAAENNELTPKVNETMTGSEHAPESIKAEHDNNTPLNTSLEAPSTSAILQAWADRALHFLSHASNETLGACIVGLGASTYLVLGRVGLVLIGVVGGIALHATWEGVSGGPGAAAVAKEMEARRRKELGVEVVDRVWRWREAQSTVETAEGDKLDTKVTSGKMLDFSTFDPQTSAALDTFVGAVMRDYVKWWYSPVIPGEETFPSACRQTLTSFLLSLSSHLSRKRPADMFLDFVTNSSSIVIVFLNELSAALNASPNSEASVAIDTYMELKPDSSLARVLDADHQGKKLDMVAEDILQNYLDSKVYNCAPAHVFLKEVMSKLVLDMTIQTCSKPEWINGWIVYLLEDGEPELLQQIDASVDKSSVGNSQVVPEEASAASAGPSTESPRHTSHQRNRSRAEEAMDEAMKEAKRLTQLIADEEARKDNERRGAASSSEDVSENAVQGIMTPTSSQSGSDGKEEQSARAPREGIAPAQSPAIPENLINTPTVKQPFTSFDQILPAVGITALQEQEAAKSELKPVLTLFNAKISIFDDSVPGDKGMLKSKPTTDYLVQIEPSSSAFPGWMIVRKYADFETLHEVLRRISVISGVGFTEGHGTLPPWRMHTKGSLRGELERYLTDAVRYQQLAESEGMRRFLEKDQGLSRSPSAAKGFGWPTPSAFDSMGKGMLDVLTKAPKDVAGGGKSFFGGVSNVLGGKKQGGANPNRASISASPSYMSDSYMGTIGFERESSDSVRDLPAPTPQLPPRPSVDIPSISRPQTPQAPSTPQELRARPSLSSRRSSGYGVGRPSGEGSRSSSVHNSQPEPSQAMQETFSLPPPPSAIDDYDSSRVAARASARASQDTTRSNLTAPIESTETPPRLPARTKSKKKLKAKPPITEQETQVAIELLFAVITELYTLSSAWNIRRTLLTAAKSFLLRPGNPQLEAIRMMIQDSVLDSNTSDAGLAALVLKVRENSLPTEDELKKWPAPISDKEKEDLRIKARKLLVERGMPQALTSVMGAAASGEALGKVFDCLQVESVARSLVFGLMLQALRAMVQ